jgi:hypothetical protein
MSERPRFDLVMHCPRSDCEKNRLAGAAPRWVCKKCRTQIQVDDTADVHCSKCGWKAFILDVAWKCHNDYDFAKGTFANMAAVLASQLLAVDEKNVLQRAWWERLLDNLYRRRMAREK